MRLLLLAVLACLAPLSCSGRHVSPSEATTQARRVADAKDVPETRVLAANLALPVDVREVASPGWAGLIALGAAYQVLTSLAISRLGHPLAVATAQFLTVSAFNFIARVRTAPSFGKEKLLKLLPCAALHAFAGGLLLLAFPSGVGLVNTIRQMSCVGALVLAGLFDRSVPKPMSSLAAAVSVIGSVYSTSGRLDLDAFKSFLSMKAVRYTLGSLATLTVRSRFFRGADGIPDIAAYDNLLAALMLIPTAMHFEGKRVFANLFDNITGNLESFAYLIGSGLAIALVHDNAGKVDRSGEKSAVAFLISKLVTFTAIGVFVKETFSRDRLIGIAIAVLGSYAFDIYSLRKI